MANEPLPPEVKQKILAAYKKFRLNVGKIARDHHTTVTRIMDEIDQKHVDQIKKQIG